MVPNTIRSRTLEKGRSWYKAINVALTVALVAVLLLPQAILAATSRGSPPLAPQSLGGGDFAIGQDASLVLGQANLTSGDWNRGSSLAANTIYYPQGIAFDGPGNLWRRTDRTTGY